MLATLVIVTISEAKLPAKSDILIGNSIKMRPKIIHKAKVTSDMPESFNLSAHSQLNKKKHTPSMHEAA